MKDSANLDRASGSAFREMQTASYGFLYGTVRLSAVQDRSRNKRPPPSCVPVEAGQCPLARHKAFFRCSGLRSIRRAPSWTRACWAAVSLAVKPVGKPDPRGAESVVHVDAFPAGREAALPRGFGRIIRIVIAILLVGWGRSASPLTQTRHPTTRTARRRRGWALGEQA